MTQAFSISQTQRQMILEAAKRVNNAQAALNGLYGIILAQHDITEAPVINLTDEGLVVTFSDPVVDPVVAEDS